LARVTTDWGSGSNLTACRYVMEFPVVIAQLRKSLMALALAGSRWPVLTTAYS